MERHLFDIKEKIDGSVQKGAGQADGDPIQWQIHKGSGFGKMSGYENQSMFPNTDFQFSQQNENISKKQKSFYYSYSTLHHIHKSWFLNYPRMH